MAMTLVSSVVVGSGGATTLEFANIPQTGKDLLLKLSLRDTAGVDTTLIQLNNSSSNFVFRWLRNSGSSGASNDGSSNFLDSTINPSSFTASTFSIATLYLPNYANTNFKQISWDTVTENNATSWLAAIGGMRWSTSAAISNLKIIHFNTNAIAQHSIASLYIIS